VCVCVCVCVQNLKILDFLLCTSLASTSNFLSEEKVVEMLNGVTVCPVSECDRIDAEGRSRTVSTAAEVCTVD
jgi:hypothetical protein